MREFIKQLLKEAYEDGASESYSNDADIHKSMRKYFEVMEHADKVFDTKDEFRAFIKSLGNTKQAVNMRIIVKEVDNELYDKFFANYNDYPTPMYPVYLITKESNGYIYIRSFSLMEDDNGHIFYSRDLSVGSHSIYDILDAIG